MKEQTLHKEDWDGTNLEFLMNMLASKNGMICWKARKSLVTLGNPAVPSLIRTLQNAKLDHLRWEVVKILGAIGDAKAIPSLVMALEDKSPDVAWLAAEALKKLKKAAWPALLHTLIKRGPYSVLLRQGAHHVLKNEKENGFNDLLKTLIKALELESGETPGTIAVTAYEILKRMEKKS